MKIAVTVLGSGTGVATARRSPPGFLMQAPRAEGGCVLIDPGPGSVSRMVAAGVPLEKVDRVVLTHFHPDHTLDLTALLFARRNSLFENKLERLTIIGPPGTREFHDKMQVLYGNHVLPRYGEIEIVEVDQPGWNDRSGLRGLALPVEHPGNAVGYRFEFSAGSIAFSGDSGVCDHLIDLGREADLFFLECALPDQPPPASHLGPATAARVAAAAQPRELVLHHFYPHVDVEAAVKTVQSACGGTVFAAEDGAVYTLGDKTDR